MNSTDRLPHAANTPLPELAAFLTPFHPHFLRSEGRHLLERYVTGVLSEHPNKNCDTLAQVIPGTSEQSLQNLLTTMRWDDTAVNEVRVQRMRALPTDGDGVLVLDDTGFVKKGTASAGVARQYTGTTGKVDNCQVAVTCVYAERTVSWPVSARLYLPQSWADDAPRRAKAHVPDAITFQTKPEIALAQIDQARDMGVPYRCITVDGAYGDVPSFLDGLEGRDERYVAAVHRDFTIASHADGRDPHRADQRADAQRRRAWRTLTWREGTAGPLKARFVALRAWRKDDLERWREGWLLAERPARGQRGKQRYYWSNLPPDTPLETLAEYAHRRHWIEQFHEEAKELLGWDQYQGRRWDGFHRHALLIMIAYSFLVWQEWQQRQHQRRRGRPRGRFSPRRDGRRMSLASLQRQIVDWLRVLALQELRRLGSLATFRPQLC
jgi:SRSO17 transposase